MLGYLEKAFEDMLVVMYGEQTLAPTQRTDLRDAYFGGVIVALGVDEQWKLTGEIEEYSRDLQRRRDEMS
jgi:hypothetical protein